MSLVSFDGLRRTDAGLHGSGAHTSPRRASGRRARLAPLLVATTALLAPATACAAAANPPRTTTLSNLKTLTRWAYPQSSDAARSAPLRTSRVVGHLQFLTSEGQAELYLELRSVTIGGHTWILVPIPGRPNGLQGWVPAGALSEAHVTTEHLRVNREAFRATLYRGHAAIWSAPVGVGRPSLPTPAGHFYVMEKLISREPAVYGPYALGTSAYAPTLGEWPGGGVVGIHGTDEPWLIPGRPSHGCIRLPDADVSRLWQLIEVGTPIEIV
jgi:L,D-transpeptidase catalytic domain